MARYCDSAVLESNWYNWIVAKAVPDLEQYRQAGLLWTKIIGKVVDEKGKAVKRNGVQLLNPCYPVRHHFFVADEPVFVTSYGGELGVARNSLGEILELPAIYNTSLSPAIGSMLDVDYVKEMSTHDAWGLMLTDMYHMCQGIATRFNQPSEEERNDLAHEAMHQIASKLTRGKLVYTPGRAPVFSLLTTTIHRCMYSIVNRDNRHKRYANKLIEDINAGIVPAHTHSLFAATDLFGNYLESASLSTRQSVNRFL